MVSFKRKPVKIPAPDKTPVNENCPVWVIDQTLEYFTTYDAYLARMDFYNQKKFICELTGHSCLSYFEAVEKEAREARAIVTDFPEPPKEPILQKVQFSRTSRLDLLVDEVYAAVRYDFFVGEILHARTRDQQRLRVTVHEVLPPAPGSSEKRYRCDHEFYPNRFDIYESSELFRDRKNFNKMSVRTFIKYAASRENWMGCPWIVKKEYTDRYPNIPTEPPEDLKMAAKARGNRPTLNLAVPDALAESATPEPTPSSARRRKLTQKLTEVVHDKNVDDLDILAAATIDPTTYDMLKRWPQWQSEESIEEDRVGKAIQIWSFINVYNEMLVLSPISFDEFLKAIIDKNSDVLAEIICSILTLYVDPDEDILAVPFPSQYEPSSTSRKRTETKRIKNDQDEDSEGSPESEEENTTKAAEEEEEEEEDEMAKDDPMSSESEDHTPVNHNAEEYLGLGGVDWMLRIGKRDFANGGWQSLVICTLSESSYMREWLPTIEGLLAVLAVKDTPVSLESATENWKKLNSSQKLDALDYLVQILHTAPALRQFMETRGEQSTKIRKDRAEVSREQKLLLDSIKLLREKRAASVMPSDELINEYDEAVAAQEVLAEKNASLSNELLHYDCGRIRLLGKDRFFNRYWWLESNGVERIPLKANSAQFFLMSRIWIQGPTAEDFNKRLNNFAINIRITDRRDRASEVAWQEKCTAITLHREQMLAARRASEERKLRSEAKQKKAANANKTPKGSASENAPAHSASAQTSHLHLSTPSDQPQQATVEPAIAQAQQPVMQGVTQTQPIQQPQSQQLPMLPMMQGPPRGVHYMAPNGTPMYYPQQMYPLQQNMPQGQYMMQMPMQQFSPMTGQQIMYMAPQMINGIQTLVPVQMPQGLQFNQQFPGAAPMPMQFQVINGQMQAIPQAPQMQMQMPMQMSMQGHSRGFPQMHPMQVPQGMMPIQQSQQGQPMPAQQQQHQPAQSGQPNATPRTVQATPSTGEPMPSQETLQVQQTPPKETKLQEFTEAPASSTQVTEIRPETNPETSSEAIPAAKKPVNSPNVSPKTTVSSPQQTSDQPKIEVTSLAEGKRIAVKNESEAVENDNLGSTESIDDDSDVIMIEQEQEEDSETTAPPEPVETPVESSEVLKPTEASVELAEPVKPEKAPTDPSESTNPIGSFERSPALAQPVESPAKLSEPMKPAMSPVKSTVATENSVSTVASSASSDKASVSRTAPSTASPSATPVVSTPVKKTELHTKAENTDWRFVKMSASFPSSKPSGSTPKKDASDARSDTDDESFGFPAKEKLQPLTALGLKKTVEGSLMLTKPHEWRYYDNEEELNQLELYLMRNSVREGELLDKILKLDPAIRACFKARETVLEQGSKEWTNELAKTELGHYHSAPKGRRRGKR